MSDLLAKVRNTIRARGLLGAGETVLVAVSGGCDSMVLLHLLHRLHRLRRLGKNARWQLVVAHFNHRLRGRASDRDQQLVVQSAEALGLVCLTEAANVAEHAAQHSLSIEMAARELRHAFLARAAREVGASKIALAHHADDQIETFFLRLLRGSGGEGLAGMKFASPSPADPSVQLLRPLLEISKTELADYARIERIPFREDASNRRLDPPRNFVRRRLVPLLRQRLQPALASTITRLMAVIGDEADFVDAAARGWLGGPRKSRFDDLAVAVQRRILLHQLQRLRVEPSFALIETLRLEPVHPVTVRAGFRVWRDAAGSVQGGSTAAPAFDLREAAVALGPGPGKLEFTGVRISWEVKASLERTRKRVRPRPGRERFDAHQVGARITLRHWRPGDRFQPIGLARPAKLQDLFTNARVPRAERHGRVVAVAACGDLFWVEGLRIGERFKLTGETRQILDWRWKRAVARPEDTAEARLQPKKPHASFPQH